MASSESGGILIRNSPQTSLDDPEALCGAVQRLLGKPVVDLLPAGRGANSTVFRVICSDREYALKTYPRWRRDRRQRETIEWRCLQFLSAHGIDRVPHPVAYDPEARIVIMEWIDGDSAVPHTVDDVDEAVSFLIDVFGFSSVVGAEAFPQAAEACLSVRAVTGQIESRLDAFAAIPAVMDLLEDEFAVAFNRACSSVSSSREELASHHRRLIPADFGFHNAIRGPAGGLVFFDFDYFGWDDPVKVAADFAFPLADPLSASEVEGLVGALARALPEDDTFMHRFRERAPLFLLRWSLIVLNPFRQDRAGMLPEAPEQIERLLSERLATARKLIKASEQW